MLTLHQINDSDFLVGFSKKDVIRELGDGFNFIMTPFGHMSYTEHGGKEDYLGFIISGRYGL